MKYEYEEQFYEANDKNYRIDNRFNKNHIELKMSGDESPPFLYQ